ncbi:GntR family transcriptional regulator [Nocardia sp. NEAU-G5]|uniref:GntR family transcriptional regulator n=1 Tax=Nocardia albiluteola TaxID=2842303 RepID=A0ABS6BF40_9NOCA|nr:GntR family transcriptional regulator [Nocardia albiluteola]MBU3068050.1 GntR family transcriptional regulator [Nocardia albiluteola]
MSDRVHDELMSAIRDLRLEPGALLSEAELSVQLGVSRTPLREAISRLVDQGLLSVVSQVRTSVALIDLSQAREACFIRRALETAAFQQACESGGDVGELRRILLRQEQAVADRDVEAFFVSDEDLHQEIFRLGGYPGLWNVIQRSKLQLDRLRRLAFSETVITRDVIDEHIRIVDLLENRDVEEGIRVITVHSRHVLDQAGRVQSEHPGYFTP